jgi:hypothetical protein
MMDMGMPEWQVDGVIELYKLVAAGEPCLTSAVSDLPAILRRDLATPASLAAYVAPGLKAIKAASEYEAQVAAAEAAEKLESMKLAASEASEAIKAAERVQAEKLAAEKAAAHVKATRVMINNGGLVLKKMGTETAFKSRFVWIDEEKRTLNWAKGEAKDGPFKSAQLAPGVVVSAPVFNAAKGASLFGGAEPDGFVVSVTESGKPSVDLKVRFYICSAILLLCSVSSFFSLLLSYFVYLDRRHRGRCQRVGYCSAASLCWFR